MPTLRNLGLALAGLLLVPAVACGGRTNASDDAGPAPASTSDPSFPTAPTSAPDDTDPKADEGPDPSTLSDAGADANGNTSSDAGSDASMGDAGPLAPSAACYPESLVVDAAGHDTRETALEFPAAGVTAGKTLTRSLCGSLLAGKKVYLSLRLRPTTKTYRWSGRGTAAFQAATGADALASPNDLRFSTTEAIVFELTANGKTDFALRMEDSE